VQGLQEFPREQWPLVALTFLSFHNMVILGNLMLLIALLGGIQLWRKAGAVAHHPARAALGRTRAADARDSARLMAAEVGRQPWIVYG
jgi:cytochrome d ubiquinol oxidase subunit I